MNKADLLQENLSGVLQLERPIVFFDLETTGTRPAADRIIEIYGLRLSPGGEQEEIHHFINPGIPIPAESTAIHGITDEMVRDKPSFDELSADLAVFFGSADLGGYNVRRFDAPMLMEEFHRCKKYPIRYSAVRIVDVMSIFYSKEKRDLSAAVKFYCDREHEGAHSARADVLATVDILKQQLLKYDDLQPNASFLHEYLSGGTVDLSGQFIRNEKGEVLFNFGKHKGKPAISEPGYLEWMLTGEFAIDSKMVARRMLKNVQWDIEIRQWLTINGILENRSTVAALHHAITSGKDVQPFSLVKKDEQIEIQYLETRPYSLVHEDAVKNFTGYIGLKLSTGISLRSLYVDNQEIRNYLFFKIP